MVACTLDYNWPTSVIASLIVLVGGLVIMLVVRYVRQLSSIRSRRQHACHSHLLSEHEATDVIVPEDSARQHGCYKHLLNVQEAADVILSGDSLLSKFFVSCASIIINITKTVTSHQTSHQCHGRRLQGSATHLVATRYQCVRVMVTRVTTHSLADPDTFYIRSFKT